LKALMLGSVSSLPVTLFYAADLTNKHRHDQHLTHVIIGCGNDQSFMITSDNQPVYLSVITL